MKPDDVPQWAWEEADDTTYNIETDGHGSIEYTEARASIARLVMKARSQAYEEAASIIDENMLCSTGDGEEVLLPRGNSGNTVGTAYSKAIRSKANQ